MRPRAPSAAAKATPAPQRLPGRDDRPPLLTLPLRVRFAGLTFDLPATAPAHLWQLCAANRWVDLLPGLAPRRQAEALWQRVGRFADPLDLPDVAAAAARVGSALAGIDWAAAVRIAGTCEANRFVWQAWQVRYHFDPGQATFDRLLAAGYAFLIEAADSQETLDAALWAPPPGGPRWGAADEARAFAEALNSVSDPRRA